MSSLSTIFFSQLKLFCLLDFFLLFLLGRLVEIYIHVKILFYPTMSMSELDYLILNFSFLMRGRHKPIPHINILE